jgi:serine/threonine protein kinase
MQLREVPEKIVATALEQATGSASEGSRQRHRVLKSDSRARVSAVEIGEGHQLVVKEYRAGGPLRRAADVFRGSPARRAWLGGHGLRARGIGAATPIAFVERRRWGIPMASAIVLEDLQHFEPADHCSAKHAGDEEVVKAIVRLAIRLHRRGVVHGDLKASHLLLGREASGIEAYLIDLEGVRFPRRLRDRDRIRALAQLNASLPDRIPEPPRTRAFLRYAAALPFQCGTQAALRRVVEISLARRHRWTGADCQIARELRRDNVSD